MNSAFILTREDARRTYPKFEDQIMSCETPSELASQLEEIREAREEAKPPAPAPAGAISLKPEDAIPTINREEKFDSPGHLVNTLMHRQYYGEIREIRVKAKAQLRELWKAMGGESGEKVVKMLKGPNFAKVMGNMKVCPRCGAPNEQTAEVCVYCHRRFGGKDLFTTIASAKPKGVLKKKGE